MTGSSPLTRGKRGNKLQLQTIIGLIPAHAGKTSMRTATRLSRRAHPRSRGENAALTAGTGMKLGSSPLTRGKLLCRASRQDGRGLIPAHAGKTASPRRRSYAVRAHPRSRGENRLLRPRPRAPLGSSPLTRGKQVAVDGSRGVGGLIPAHAGKTVCPASGRWSRGAHPRSRGENETAAANASVDAGSSPLTRGKRNTCQLKLRVRGLIPAHAGKTRR